MTRTKHLFLTALLVVFVAAPARADTPTEKKPAKGVVPFEVLKTGHMRCIMILQQGFFRRA